MNNVSHDQIYERLIAVEGKVDCIDNNTKGRDVGYKIEQESFDDATHAISATKIRKQMGV
jgi:hypothetical protein